MKLLLIWASPNKDGLTAQSKNQILNGICAASAEAETIHLNHCNIEHCRACGDGWGLCRAQGNCVIQDDFSQLYDKCAKADGIIFVTPVYWHDMAECLKNFLDRLRRCETQSRSFAERNQRLRDKYCLLVACAGGTGRGAIQCLHQMEETINHIGMIAVDRLPVIQFNRDYMLPALSGAGQKFADNLQSRA